MASPRQMCVALVVVVGAVTAACSGVSAVYPTVPQTPLPLAFGHPDSLCATFFGPSSAIAREFNVSSLVLEGKAIAHANLHSTSGVVGNKGTLRCGYLLPQSVGAGSYSFDLTLALMSQGPVEIPVNSISARSGDVWAIAIGGGQGPGSVHVSARNRPWLKAAAARATAP